MAITIDDAKAHLNKTTDDDDVELLFFVNAANEWMAAEVGDTTSYTVQLATRMLVAHWWETQRGPAGNPIDGDDAERRGSWFSIPNKVRELLQSKHSTATTPRYDFPDVAGWPDQVSN